MKYIVLGVGIVLLLAAPVHGDQTVAAVSKNGDVEFHALTRVGPTTLIAGLYAIRYAKIDDRPYVIVNVRKVSRAGRPPQHYVSIKTGDEVARVLCEVVLLDHEPKTSEIELRVENNGTMTVTQIRIRGENGHIVALVPRQQE